MLSLHDALPILDKDKAGNDVYLKDLWPTMDEIKEQVKKVVNPEIFRSEYENVFDSNERWNQIETPDEPLFTWDTESTYIQNPPFFENLSKEPTEIKPLSEIGRASCRERE